MRRRFFTDKFENSRAVLCGEAAHHLGRVLRAEPGQVYELSDGTSVRLGSVVRVGRDVVEFELGEFVACAAPRLTAILLLAVVKFDRFEWALEKATELGVSEVVPLSAARSEKALVAAAAKRAARWERILVESAQQARRLRPPRLGKLAKSPDAFAICGQKVSGKIPRILLSERPGALPLRDVLPAFPRDTTNNAVISIGPEGGWTEEEFAAAHVADFAEASLGQAILRTETAVAAALASLNYALGD